MSADIRIAISFKNNRKREKLKMILGAGSTDYLLDLWITAAIERPSGVLTGWDEFDIAFYAGWKGTDPAAFVKALEDAGFLEKNNEGVYCLHNWEKRNPYVSGEPERKLKARFSRLAATYPRIYAELRAQGVTAISQEEYQALTKGKRPSDENNENNENQRIVNEPLTASRGNQRIVNEPLGTCNESLTRHVSPSPPPPNISGVDFSDISKKMDFNQIETIYTKYFLRTPELGEHIVLDDIRMKYDAHLIYDAFVTAAANNSTKLKYVCAVLANSVKEPAERSFA